MLFTPTFYSKDYFLELRSVVMCFRVPVSESSIETRYCKAGTDIIALSDIVSLILVLLKMVSVVDKNIGNFSL